MVTLTSDVSMVKREEKNSNSLTGIDLGTLSPLSYTAPPDDRNTNNIFNFTLVPATIKTL